MSASEALPEAQRCARESGEAAQRYAEAARVAQRSAAEASAAFDAEQRKVDASV